MRTSLGVGTDKGSDAALWRAALRGDGEAFGVLFDRHRDAAFRAALRSGANAFDSEDIVASAFLTLWHRRRDVPLVDGSIRPWLLASVHNVARNLARHRRRYASFLQQLPAEPSTRSAEDIALEAAQALDRAQRATSLLSQLPPRDAHILTLAAVEEFDTSTIADVLGISAEAARQRLSRARKRARDIHGGNVDLAHIGGLK